MTYQVHHIAHFVKKKKVKYKLYSKDCTSIESCLFLLVLVDKDNNPKWKPGSLADVSNNKVKSYFKTLGDRELVL